MADDGLHFDEEDQHVQVPEASEEQQTQEQQHNSDDAQLHVEAASSDDIADKLENLLDEAADHTKKADVEKVIEVVTSSSKKKKSRNKHEKKLSKLEEESAYAKFQRHQEVDIKLPTPQLKSGLVTMNKFRQKTVSLLKNSTVPKLSVDVVLRKREQIDNSHVNLDDDNVELEVVDFLEKQPANVQHQPRARVVTNVIGSSIEPPHIETQTDRLDSDDIHPMVEQEQVVAPVVLQEATAMVEVSEKVQPVEGMVQQEVEQPVVAQEPTPMDEDEDEEDEDDEDAPEEDDEAEGDDNEIDHPEYVNIEERPEPLFPQRNYQAVASTPTTEPKRPMFVAPANSKGARLLKLALSQSVQEDVTSSQQRMDDDDDDDKDELPELHTPTPRAKPNTANLVAPSFSLSIQIPSLSMPSSLDPSSATPLGRKRPRSFLENGGAQKAAKFAKTFNEQKRKENILPNVKKSSLGSLQPPKKKRRVK